MLGYDVIQVVLAGKLFLFNNMQRRSTLGEEAID